jgi:SRSO17 transposase
MGANRSAAPAPQHKRLTAYFDWLAPAVKHADRVLPLQNYCKGLLLDGQRKSIEPMAARLAPDRVQRMHESLHHFVASSPWSADDLLRRVREYVLPQMEKAGAVRSWIVDETSFQKWGNHSVGVARQYCGRLGKKENCQVSVSLSIATESCSLPIAWRLYLPESWANDAERRKTAGVPERIRFQTKPQIALEQIRESVEQQVPVGVVLADSVYGCDQEFRSGVAKLNLQYAVAVKSTTTFWALDRQPLPPKPPTAGRRAAKRLRRDADHQPFTAAELAHCLPGKSWHQVEWREGSKKKLQSRFAAVWGRPAYGDDRKTQLQAEQWILIEWPADHAEPSRYWLLNLPANTSLQQLVETTMRRWMIERDYEELKQEVGLGDYEGRNWLGLHHHASLCIAAYGFLVAERNRFSPSARVGHLALCSPRIPARFRARGSPNPCGTA